LYRIALDWRFLSCTAIKKAARNDKNARNLFW
jgi:hypothetical protein